MKRYVHYIMIAVTGLLLVGFCFLGATPITIKAISQFDDLVTNPSKPVTVVLGYHQPEKTEKDLRKQLEKARKGFSELSKQKLYKRADVQFLFVNLVDFPALQKEFGITSEEEGTIIFVVYHKGNMIDTQTLVLLDDEDIKELVAEQGQNFINLKAGDHIDDIIQDKADREFELAKARAQAPVYYSPWYYDPWWGYRWGYGYGYRWGCGGCWW